ncbi:MAG: Leu/Phe/Val dehydrogenase [Bacillota bacterium]|uniref:Glu/Leu/Phe/Val dehydrogenase n=1 Tax=Virgibacillus salarius TaxID=447199 RepID=A0A941I9U1_9BACI|nr:MULTISPECIES: Glu/Leu/Phe/Val dehydrogenase [Bacillaceae]NAZ07452.1 leucine dehydrogenase [Agaribacter marinus]MBR7794732.1 Glu/Leu/Phe/Val dehydrogenase [Virgibacillus salarius]MCC2249586.1 Glu/Leu/Phe/Val dehydrogenase [Virgibacillus sp. AGTR]MDY7044530.1 Glu/Leu/Phe/Val dehydrogenase [Virgibacillus sp. M23]QRZ19333.1 Glu/Leu/Phe/Val dehydrogenase [Virgibacillus sp. AGTR]
MKQLEQFNAKEVDMFQKISSHEQVIFCNDPSTNLQAIIAIHNTTLGPALGGTRMYPYTDVSEALEDVLRLSEGMTAKCAASDVDFGGGKAVIIGDPQKDKSPAMFRSFGQFVNSLNGRFYTGTDMGTTMDDFVHASKETNFINGIPEEFGGSGDTSIPTAQGMIYALKATCQFLYRNDDLSGKRYAIQGLGKVGTRIAEHLLQLGTELYVTDINEKRIDDIKEKAKVAGASVIAVDSRDIYTVDADIFVPCAMGGILNERTIPQLNVKAVVGSANNQLASKLDAERLREREIMYAPDFIVNAGGLIQVADELYGSNKERVLVKTKSIYNSVLDIYKQARLENITTIEAANKKCQRQLQEQHKRNNFYVRNQRPKWDFKR